MTLTLIHKNRSSYKELPSTKISVYIILITCLGIASATLVSVIHGPIIFTGPSLSFPISSIDLGSINGFVVGSDGVPIDGAVVHAYKQMGLMDSADKKSGYSTSVLTNLDGSYTLDSLPSGVYRITVTNQDGIIQTIDQYAVWPSSSSSYTFEE